MLFRLVLYNTKEENKYEAEQKNEWLGDRSSIWWLWWVLTEKEGLKHVEVYNMSGEKQQPERGINGMSE